MDWLTPPPKTYEETVKLTQEVMKMDLKDVPIKELLSFLGSSMNTQLRLKHDLPEEVLDLKVTWKLENIRRIELMAKIADVTNSDIRIEVGIVRLIHKAEAKDVPSDGDKPSN